MREREDAHRRFLLTENVLAIGGPVETLYIIRHGETEWNQSCRLQGQTDVPLSAEGRRQAERLGRRLREVPVEVVFVSPLARAEETAQIVFGGRTPPPRVLVLEELKERGLGEMEGLTRAEAKARYPFYRGRGTAQLGEVAPGGEPLEAFFSRVRKAREVLEEDAAATGAVVAHGGSLSVLIALLLGIPPGRVRLDNASLTVLTRRGGWRLHVLNSTRHLLER